MRAKLVFLGLFLCQTVTFSQPSLSQERLSVIRGRLTQVSGVPLYYARVTAISFSTGEQYWASSDRAGEYVMEHLPEDSYKVRFESAGFKPYSEEFISTMSGIPAEISVRLADLDSDQMSGSVRRESSILKIDHTDVSTVFTREEIENLPIYNQNLSRLELLVPGALPSPDILGKFQNPQQSTCSPAALARNAAAQRARWKKWKAAHKK